MAESTQFDHDRIGHLLADRLLDVPRFQRRYSWDVINVSEYLSDLEKARRRGGSYFLGTVVLAQGEGQRQIVVDGQQRLATTAILLVAARDHLRSLGKAVPSEHIQTTYLRSYDMKSDGQVERFLMASADQEDYEAILDGKAAHRNSKIDLAYRTCLEYFAKVAPASDDFAAVVDVVTQLSEDVQVLVAVAKDLPEAYVIFETLNDRGAALTTGDLLKNYLFSSSGDNFKAVEQLWIEIEANFDKADDLVKYIRYEYMSRRGRVASRNLYRVLQEDIGRSPMAVRDYVRRLRKTMDAYLALRDPDHERWNSINVDVRDSLLANRRFGFESNTPLLLAIFAAWPDDRAAAALVKVTGWTVRSLFAGKLGDSLAEESFAEAARAVSAKEAKNQDDIREGLSRMLPSDAEFMQYFASSGDIKPPRAKYLLAMLERARRIQAGESVEALPDWSSKSVNIEHFASQQSGKASPGEVGLFVNRLGNLGALERTLNNKLGNLPFAEKRKFYGDSAFFLTREVGRSESWGRREVDARMGELAKLAVIAWPL